MNKQTDLTTINGHYRKADTIPYKRDTASDPLAVDDLTTWRNQSRYVVGDDLTADDVLNMTDETFAFLAYTAARGAAKGRALASDPIGLCRTEDADTAIDAVERVYGEVIAGREHRSIAGRCYWAGRTMGKKRAKQRVFERASPIVAERTDERIPEADAAMTWEQILAAAPPAKRELLNQQAALWKEGKDKNRNAVRAIRRAIGVRSPANAPRLG